MSHPQYVQRNRALWDERADDYQEQHLRMLSPERPGWGIWKIPEDELRVLGDVAGRDVLEIGCGAAQWSIALAQRGARPVGLDISSGQLEHARRLMRGAEVEFPLVHASAEAVPLPDGSFDIVFCDYGATSFTDPHRTIPEAARLLRPNGLLAFSGLTPLAHLCWPGGEPHIGEQLACDYHDMHKLDDRPDDVVFQLPYGEWVRLFRRCGLLVEDIVELRPPSESVSTYCGPTDHAWARRWPMDHIWKARKPDLPRAVEASSRR